jgi:hypothetical protein
MLTAKQARFSKEAKPINGMSGLITTIRIDSIPLQSGVPTIIAPPKAGYFL